MTVAAPFALLAFIPLIGIAAWVLRGRAEAREVPFLNLWPVSSTRTARTNRWRLPSMFVLLILLAASLLILAIADVRLRGGGANAKFTLVRDRSPTMLSVVNGKTRLALAEARVASVLGDSIEFRELDADRRTIDETVGRALRENDGPVIVLSDRRLLVKSDRVTLVTPESDWSSVPDNVGFDHAAVRVGKVSQIMLTIRNTTSGRSLKVEVETGGVKTVREIRFETNQETTDVFVDLPGVGDEIVARVIADDPIRVDNQIRLVRRGGWMRFDVDAGVSRAASRIATVYQSGNPSAAPTAVARIVMNEIALGNTPGVIELRDDAIGKIVETTDVKFLGPFSRVGGQRLLNASFGRAPDKEGWLPAVTANGVAVVSVRESPVRQVAIGLLTDSWADTTDFVVLWAAALDWVAEGSGTEYTASEDSMLKVRLDAESTPDWEARLRRAAERAAAEGTRSTREILAGLAVTLLAAACWQRKS